MPIVPGTYRFMRVYDRAMLRASGRIHGGPVEPIRDCLGWSQVRPDANMWTTLLVVFPNRSVARHLSYYSNHHHDQVKN